jgi:hypothetical protein
MIPIFEMKTLIPQGKLDEKKVEELEKGKGPIGSTPLPQFGD